MKEFRATLIERIPRTASVESFRFKPGENIDFSPGQFAQVLFDPLQPQNKELNKYLSFSSSPTKEYFEVTKRLSNSIFSDHLRNLKVGDQVSFKAPFGNCVFKPEYKKICFIIGGIGITPVISIIEYIMDKNLKDTDISLTYSNRTDEDIAFKKELDAWKSANKNLAIVYVVTDCEPKDNTCIRGTINKNLLQDKICNIKERIIFVFGPPRMVDALSALCGDLGCSRDNIRTESFFGY